MFYIFRFRLGIYDSRKNKRIKSIKNTYQYYNIHDIALFGELVGDTTTEYW